MSALKKELIKVSVFLGAGTVLLVAIIIHGMTTMQGFSIGSRDLGLVLAVVFYPLALFYGFMPTFRWSSHLGDYVHPVTGEVFPTRNLFILSLKFSIPFALGWAIGLYIEAKKIISLATAQNVE